MALKSINEGNTGVEYVTACIASGGGCTLTKNFCGILSAAGYCGAVWLNDGYLLCSSGGTYPTQYGTTGPLVVAAGSDICAAGVGSAVMSGYFFD